jgi:hypothetical protein
MRFSFYKASLRLGWWGVAGWCVLALALFTHVTQGQLDELTNLKKRQEELHEQHQRILLRNQQLRCQIQSQDRPGWIEQRLMSRLGVIPKGTRKVVFIDPTAP